MNVRNEEVDIPDTPTSRIAFDAMIAIEELLMRGVVLDVIAETVPDEHTAEAYTRWWKNTHYLLRDIHSRAIDIERGGEQ